MLTALLRDKSLSRYTVFAFLLTTCTSVTSFVFVGPNLWQFTTFALFRFSSSYVLLINIVACVY